MISELWHREQPSRKLINTGCCRRLPPPPHPCSCLSKGFPPSFPSAASSAVAISPPAPCPGCRESRDVHPTAAGLLRSIPVASPSPPALSGNAFLQWHPSPWNKSCSKCHQLCLSPVPPPTKLSFRPFPFFPGNLSRQQIAGGNYAVC